MRVEIINTGTELLLGHVINRHLAFLAQSLFGVGLRVDRQITVPDGIAIAEALETAMARAELIIVTGGLGPTSDDITRDAAAEAFGRKLIFHQEILDGIEAKMTRRKIKMTSLQRSQAMVPEQGVVLDNHFGTAPGLIIENDRTVAVLLPGPPSELNPMWENEALPWLKQHFAARWAPTHEVQLRIIGTGETAVQHLVEDEIRALGPVEIGYCARAGEVDLRLIAPDGDLVQRAAALVRGKLADAIYTEGTEPMEQVVVRLAKAAGKKIATAESCTGGLVASRIVSVPSCSEIFRYGWVTYADEAKIAELGVPAALLAEHGAVSAPTAAAMAEGALKASGADLAVAITGIAGPSGGTETKPVGLVYFGLASRTAATKTLERTLSPRRETFRTMASQIALDLLRRALVPSS
jgi:nicotinamide-nucleotide amidase